MKTQLSSMSRKSRISISIAGLCIVALGGLLVVPLWAIHPTNPGPQNPEIKFHLPIPRPLPVEDALKTFKLPPGFRIECVASDPLIEDPVTCRFDAQGRIWIVELRGYMHDLAGGGEKDAVGRIKILESTQHDGKYDKATIFLDNLVMPRAVLPTRGGALVGVPPELAFYKEVDGKAGEKTVISTNYGVKGGQPESMANGLLPDLDNWIYNAAHSYRYRFVNGKWVYEFSRSRGQWGIGQDDYGRLYYCTNTDLCRADPFPNHYFSRNPLYPASAAQNIELMPFADQYVWPGHPTPGTNRGYTTTELRADGSLTHPTAACGDTIYRGGLFPPDFENNMFTPEPAGNLIKRLLIEDEAGRLVAKHAYKEMDFLTSTDERFRPVNTCVGPDGALYVVDMYRGVLEHSAFLTNYLIKNIEERKLLMPIHKGRIYRIVTEGAAPKPVQMPTDALALVPLLAHPNGWVRDMAQRLLVEKPVAKTIPMLEEMATNHANPLARLHALWTLEGLGRLEPQIALRATTDADPHVRVAAIRLCEPQLVPVTRALALPALLSLMEDANPDVQLQLGLTLSAIDDPSADDAVTTLLTHSTASPDMMRDCVISGLLGRELDFIEKLLARSEWKEQSSGRRLTLAALSRCVIAEHHTKGMTHLLQLTAAEPDGSWRQVALLEGVLPPPSPTKLTATTQPTTQATTKPTTRTSSQRIPIRLIYLDAEPPTLAGLLASHDVEVQKLAKRLDGRLAWPGKPGVPERPKIVPLTPSQQVQFDRGKVVFTQICAACHQPTGLGQEGLAPPLVDSEWVLGPQSRAVRIVLQGLNGPLSVGGSQYRLEMPALATVPDEDIASVLTYIRREWEHDGNPISVETVTKIRAETRGRSDLWTSKELLEVNN